jgi:hypothetical protein
MMHRNSLRFNWCKISNAQNIYPHNKAIRTMSDSVMLLHKSFKDMVQSVLSEKIQELTAEKKCWELNLWYNQNNGKGTWDLAHGTKGACTGKGHLQQ